jgi:hypothetical protein
MFNDGNYFSVKCLNLQIIFDISYCTAYVNIDIHALLLLEFLLELDVSTINYKFYYLLFNPTAACCYIIMPIITVQSECTLHPEIY